MKWDGQKISVPGIYENVPLAKYHEDLAVGPSISSSGLRMLDPTIGKTPAHYFLTCPYNPNREPRKNTEYFTLGHAVHTLFLGQSGFSTDFVVRPEIIGGSPWQGARTVCKNWLVDQEMAGKQVLTTEHFNIIEGMAKSIAGHTVAGQGLLNGEIERSLVWQDERTGVWLKSRPDAIPTASNMISDLKTIDESDRRSCEWAIYDHGYHMQLALAEMGMIHLLGREVSDFVLVFIAKKPPYLVNIKVIDRDYINYGRRQLRRAIDIFAACLKSNEWPGWGDDGEKTLTPGWLTKRLDEEELLKTLPKLEESI